MGLQDVGFYDMSIDDEDHMVSFHSDDFTIAKL